MSTEDLTLSTLSENQDSYKFRFKEVFNVTVIVAALGYFVDVYDLVLFLVIGKASLKDIFGTNLTQEQLIDHFQFLLNVQMIGMLIGGVFWGMLGDKKGRLSVLFGSIVMYSVANIANGFVSSIEMYAVWRFIAGLGLAGELGAGITLVTEIMRKEVRGYGTMIVTSTGVLGAVVAGLVGTADWRMSYFIGGGLGLSLLLLRIGVFESGIFKTMKEKDVQKGNFFQIFHNKERALRYLNCILIGSPVWFIIGVLVGRAPEISQVLNIKGVVDQAICVMLCYTGLVFGDLASGAVSQLLKSRKKVFIIFYSLCALCVSLFLTMNNVSSVVFYTLIFCLGFSVGFWAVFVTVGSEQFGTNLRATVATTVPNFVRGSLVLVAFLFDAIYDYFKAETANAVIIAGFIVTLFLLIVSTLSLYNLRETFGKDLDYVEK
ncbi:MAG TPA: MFS transporter [Cytophagaceae bacterium]